MQCASGMPQSDIFRTCPPTQPPMASACTAASQPMRLRFDSLSACCASMSRDWTHARMRSLCRTLGQFSRSVSVILMRPVMSNSLPSSSSVGSSGIEETVGMLERRSKGERGERSWCGRDLKEAWVRLMTGGGDRRVGELW